MKTYLSILFLKNIPLINKFILFFFLYMTFCQNQTVLLFINNNDNYAPFTRLNIQIPIKAKVIIALRKILPD